MPPDVREWLPANHLAWFVIDAVGEMNLDAFYSAYRVDGRARPAYDPAMMVALLLYAYERLAREIIDEAIATDAAEDELYGDRRGDELPPEFSTSAGRRGWLREARSGWRPSARRIRSRCRGTARSASSRPSAA